ncbi:MAG: response regulator [Terriglobales bacterium]|jgi:CheY-like chemotaxis protein
MAEDQFVILCVDDEPAVLRPIEIMLQRRGFRVVVANDGASAIEIFRHIAFHAVVLDYSMPDLSGGEVARVLRGQNPQIPIILHTGYKELNDPLLANVTCTLPKGSLGFLVTKLNDLLHLPEAEQTETEVIADAELPAESQVA